jgi:hypothetical protein
MIHADRLPVRDELGQHARGDVGSPHHQDGSLRTRAPGCDFGKVDMRFKECLETREFLTQPHRRKLHQRLRGRGGGAQLEGGQEATIDHPDRIDEELVERDLRPALCRIVLPEIHQLSPRRIRAPLECVPEEHGAHGSPGRAAHADNLELVGDLRFAKRLQCASGERCLTAAALAGYRDFRFCSVASCHLQMTYPIWFA